MYELLIIGAGPAGVAAAIYAARKKIKTILVTESFGGQSIVAADIENWIGEPHISGYDLAKKMEDHLRKYSDAIEIVEGDRISSLAKTDAGFTATTKNGKTIETKFVLLASGSRHRRLEVPGEEKFEGKGVVYCSTCDAPLFAGKSVAVIGGGNSGLEAARDLLPYASQITLIVRGTAPKGDAATLDMIQKSGKVSVLVNATTLEVKGDGFVEGLVYKDTATGETKTLAVQGIFVEIGTVPNSEFLKGVVELDAYGHVLTDAKTQKTKTEGIWAAGDVTDALYKQNNVSAGDGTKAILNINDALYEEKKRNS